jgi:hypothetical protein
MEIQNRGGRKGYAKDAMIFALVFCIWVHTKLSLKYYYILIK